MQYNWSMTALQLLPPERPLPAAPPRAPGSARRSSHVDMSWPEGVPGAPGTPLVLTAAVRDLVTGADGAGSVVADASLRTLVGGDREVTGITADPPLPGLDGLIGLRAVSGWRAAARDLVPDGVLSPLGLLLDEVPIAVLLSFYAGLRGGVARRPDGGTAAAVMRDVCAGWATGATPMRAIDAGGGVPLPRLVPVPAPSADDDPLATEPREPLSVGCLRRARRIDVLPGEVTVIDAHFRDSWCDPVDGEAVLHEYSLAVELDAEGVVRRIAAEPRVLPYGECPRAAQAPQALLGRHVGEAAGAMPQELAGTASCTHLNDLLRAIACAPALAASALSPRG
jgi:hypothetical protein